MADDNLPPALRDYSEGSARDAVIGDDVERKYLVDDENEQYWWFDLKPVSWYKKNQVFSDCVSADQSGEGSLDIARYQREMMVAMTEDWSGAGEMNLQEFLTGVESDLGDQIEEWVPRPGGSNMVDGEEGNSDEPSGTEARMTRP